MRLLRETLAANPGSRPRRSHARLKKMLAQKKLVLQTTSLAAQEEPDRETRATALGAELFPHDSASDHALIEWLQARKTQPRCGMLLQQICEWGNHI